MKCRTRRKLGRFGIGRLATAVAALAVLAVSPALASLADSRLEGVARSIAEAVFGEPAAAQDCVDSSGDARQCTATESIWRCLDAARDAFSQCGEELPWYAEWMCYGTFAVDTASCVVQGVSGVTAR